MPKQGGFLEITKAQKIADKMMPSHRGTVESSRNIPDIVQFHNAVMLRKDCTSTVGSEEILTTYTYIIVAITLHQRSFLLEKMETITENPNWTQYRNQ